MLMLSSVLSDESIPLHVRNAAGLALKNALTARVRLLFCLWPHWRPFSSLTCVRSPQEANRQTDLASRWLNLPSDTKHKIKQDALMTLGSPNVKAGNFASQAVSAIAAVELPQGQWPELIETLLGFVNNATNTNLRISTLQTIGFICEAIVSIYVCYIVRESLIALQKPEILSLRSNEILTAVIHGARKEEPSPEVQLAAIHSLYNSLEFVRENFDRDVRLSSLSIPLIALIGNRASATTSCKLSAKPRKMPLSLFKSAPSNVLCAS